MPDGNASESSFLDGLPGFDEGEEFLDCWLGVGTSEPSLDDAAVVFGRAGLSILAAAVWDLGAMADVTLGTR